MPSNVRAAVRATFRWTRSTSRRSSCRPSGSGDIDIDKIRAADVETTQMGSGDLSFDAVESAAFKLTMNGSGDAAYRRILRRQLEAALTGSGDLEFDMIEAEDASSCRYSARATLTSTRAPRTPSRLRPPDRATSASKALKADGSVRIGLRLRRHFRPCHGNRAEIIVMGSGDVASPAAPNARSAAAAPAMSAAPDGRDCRRHNSMHHHHEQGEGNPHA